MSNPLEDLRLQIEATNDPDEPFDVVQRLTVVNVEGLYHVEYYGSCFAEAFFSVCEILLIPEVADTLVSLSLRGPDEGSNGTKKWDLEPLAAGRQTFPCLETFSVERSRPGDHNRTIIASSFDEEGVIAKLAAKCPRLSHLQVPSAPSPDFFDVHLPSLQVLSADAGYATQDFVEHFARSRGYSSLRCFEWGEYSEHYMDNWQSSCTPFSAYEALFASPAFRTVKRFVLRQPVQSRTLTYKFTAEDATLASIDNTHPFYRVNFR